MKNKYCVITGANAGLGYASALALAKKGATVFLVCRSEERGRQAQHSIIEESDNDQIFLVQADLSSQKDLRKAAAQINAKTQQIDILINNAAMVSSQRGTTEDGIENQFAINHLGYFLLTHLLLPNLREAREARIVNVGSGNHFRGKIYFEDLHLENNYQPLRAYNQSKLANLLFTYELDRRLKAAGVRHVSVNCADPGLNNTQIGGKNTTWLHRLLWNIRRRQGQDPGEGAKCQIYLATAPEVSGVSGKYWYQSKAIPSSELSYNQQDAQRLWEISESLCQIEDYLGS
jgi:NAD(P)-dependent dehydrogenase (short-subunit alcohol dehydrogenase family)